MIKANQIIALLVLILCLCACGQKKNGTTKNEVSKEKNLTKKGQQKPKTTKEVDSEAKDVTEGETQESEVEQKESMSPEQLAKAGELIKSASSSDIAAVDAKKKFKMYCASCHGFKGNLNVNGAKDLTKSNISLEESIAQVYFGKGLMTPFKDVLKDVEMVALAKYIETEIRN